MIGLLPVLADISPRLPTINDRILKGDNEGFFMYVDRIKDGVNLMPWTGGTYGLVRTVVETPDGPVCIKFHEGIDIKPVKRDANDVPLDIVRPIAPGVVVYACTVAQRSSYGKYVVIKHETANGPLFSLYAHLSSVSCQEGQRVGTGNKIGVLGYTGVGINKRRAHLHLEICVMINEDFTHWYDAHIKMPNYHGNYNGQNLAGFDPLPLLLKGQKGERISLPAHFASLTPEYKGRVPGGKMPSIGKMYPFLVKKGKVAPSQAKSWDITFTATGVPVALEPVGVTVAEPVLIWLRNDRVLPRYRTNKRVGTLTGGRCCLTVSGKSYFSLYRFERDELPVSSQNTPEL